MSHITSVEVEVRDLAAVKALCKEKGWTFKEGQKTYHWYGQYMGDSKVPEGMKVEDYGKCDHAIGFPNASYEVGLRVNAKGGFNLAFDSWHSGGLVPHIGQNGGLFMQGYGVAKAELEAKKRGMHVKRVPGKNGAIKLVVNGSM